MSLGRNIWPTTPTLEELSIYETGMDVAGAEVIANALAHHTTLQELHIGCDLVQLSPRSPHFRQKSRWFTKAVERRSSSRKRRRGNFGSDTGCGGDCAVDGRKPQGDEFSWTALISNHTKSGQDRQALKVYEQMLEGGVKPSSYTYVAILKACSGLKDLQRCRRIHSHVVQSGLELDVFVGTMLVDVYAKCGSLEDARRVFERMPHRTVVSWTAMIWGYAQMEDGEAALQLYARMHQEGVVPNDRTFVGALKACSSLAASEVGHGADIMCLRERSLNKARAIHSDVVMGGFESDAFVGTMLVDIYAKCGSLVDARCVFDTMPYRNVVSWTAMILGYAQMEQSEQALQLYARMQKEGVVPNERTFIGALMACASVGALQQGKEIHVQIQDQGLEVDVVIGSSLVNLYAKCGSIAYARKVFDELPSRNVVTWNALLYGYAKHSDGQLAMQCFHEMQQQGVQPDGATFTCLFVACSHGALVSEGHKYFKMMVEDYGITPSTKHYMCMVDLLGRSGCLDEAERLLRTMPFEIDGWKSLLSASRSHGDIERGQRCFAHLIAVEPDNAVPYVLLGNIYAKAGRWEDVDRIESLRMLAGAKKKAAKACIEVKKVVHEFTVGEGKSNTSSTLRSMNLRLKAEGGHVPHTELVLKAVSQKEKEEELCGHAEKLALAYGLLHTSDGTTLLVTKNLRMCDDCHSSTKIMSRLERREIIVRDAHCVHRFVDGSCSCRDRH